MKKKAQTSTERTKKFRERQKALFRKQRDFYLTESEFKALKIKLEEIRNQ